MKKRYAFALLVLAVIFAVAGVVFLYMNRSPVPLRITWDFLRDTDLKYEQRTLYKVLSRFERECRGIAHYPESVEYANIDISRKKLSWETKSRGQDTDIVITVTVRADAQLPEELEPCRGRRLSYRLFGGADAGIYMEQKNAALFYGVPRKNTGKWQYPFLSVPAYSMCSALALEADNAGQ